MTLVHAYCRVSTIEQDATIQLEGIQNKYPNANVYVETASASNGEKRPVLELILCTLRKGDLLVVWRLDRLGRNTVELLNIQKEIASKGAQLIILDQNIDTRTATGKCFLEMLSVFASFETELRKERQMAGIAKAKKEGKYRGRPVKIEQQKVLDLLSKGMTHASIARTLRISTKSVQRIRKIMGKKKTVEG